VDDHDDFHIVAREDESDRIANLLRSAGVRVRQRTIQEIGRAEYVISVHVEDFPKAEEVFSADLGPRRTFTSGA
jgi:hypothetical protein